MWSSSSSDSSSDLAVLELLEDDEPVLVRTFKMRPDYTTILNASEFKIRFRLDKASFEGLLVEIQPQLVAGTRNHGVSIAHQLLLALRFYALGTMLVSVADFVGVSKTSACRIVRSVSSAIAQLYPRYIQMASEPTPFYKIAKFPRVLGAIDCTHVRIQSPSSQIGEEFRNRKGYYSLNVQAVCDAHLKLMNVVATWPGSAHDDTIFNGSDIGAQCENGEFGNKWLLGDGAYTLKPYMLTPLPNPQTKAEQLYNESHMKTRNCVERCFGAWKTRFPVIALTMRLSLPNIHAVITATAVLHNICRLHGIEDVPPEIAIPDIEDDVPVSSNEDHEPENSLMTERQNLIQDYFSMYSPHTFAVRPCQGRWHFKFKSCKRYILKRSKKEGNVLVKGNLHYKHDDGVFQSVNRPGVLSSSLNPREIISTNNVSVAKATDVRKLLTNHYGSNWETIERLHFFVPLVSNTQTSDENDTQEDTHNTSDIICEAQESFTDLYV